LECISTTPSTIIVDGITFTKGNGKSTLYDENGGAIYSRTPGLIVRNCIFKENGVKKVDYNAGGKVVRCIFDEVEVLKTVIFTEILPMEVRVEAVVFFYVQSQVKLRLKIVPLKEIKVI
jgi:hypothetical protein